MTLKAAHAGLGLALAIATPAAAQVPAACADAHPDAAAFVAALEAEGLTLLPSGEAMPEEVVDRLSWILAAEYLLTDTGGQPLADILASQRMAAGNIARLAPLPEATTRVLIDDGADLTGRGRVVIASWRVTSLKDVEQQCRLTAPEWFEDATALRIGERLAATDNAFAGEGLTASAETPDGTLSILAFNFYRQVVGAFAPEAVIDQTLRFPEDAP